MSSSPYLASATLHSLRMTPRKVRLVANLVRGRLVQDALDILRWTPKRAALPVYKLVGSALSNAMAHASVDADQLVVSEIFVNEGPTLKRFMPRAQGRAAPIRKRSSHVTVCLGEV